MRQTERGHRYAVIEFARVIEPRLFKRLYGSKDYELEDDRALAVAIEIIGDQKRSFGDCRAYDEEVVHIRADRFVLNRNWHLDTWSITRFGTPGEAQTWIDRIKEKEVAALAEKNRRLSAYYAAVEADPELQRLRFSSEPFALVRHPRAQELHQRFLLDGENDASDEGPRPG